MVWCGEVLARWYNARCCGVGVLCCIVWRAVVYTRCGVCVEYVGEYMAISSCAIYLIDSLFIHSLFISFIRYISLGCSIRRLEIAEHCTASVTSM